MFYVINYCDRIHNIGSSIYMYPIKADRYYILDTDDLSVECYMHERLRDIIVNRGVVVRNVKIDVHGDIEYAGTPWDFSSDCKEFYNGEIRLGTIISYDTSKNLVSITIHHKVYNVSCTNMSLSINGIKFYTTNSLDLRYSDLDIRVEYLYKLHNMIVCRLLILVDSIILGVCTFLFDFEGHLLGVVSPSFCTDYIMTPLASKFALSDGRESPY